MTPEDDKISKFFIDYYTFAKICQLLQKTASLYLKNSGRSLRRNRQTDGWTKQRFLTFFVFCSTLKRFFGMKESRYENSEAIYSEREESDLSEYRLRFLPSGTVQPQTNFKNWLFFEKKPKNRVYNS